jgi:hypothetical protein
MDFLIYIGNKFLISRVRVRVYIETNLHSQTNPDFLIQTVKSNPQGDPS